MSTPRIDIRPDHWKIVRDILQKHVPQYEVWAFGSRAKWSAKDYSDLDLCVISDKPLSLSVSAALADDFSESDLPWKVDVVDWATTAESFRKIIERDKVVVQKAGKSEWHTYPLAELTINHDGKRKPVKESERKSGPYPYYGASGIVDYVDDYLIDGDYLLIAEDGENLRTRQTPIAFMARGKSWVNNHAHIVTGNDKADTRFLMYALQSADVSAYLTGAVMPKLTQGNLNRIPISCPLLDDQRAIAHILGTLDDKIELNRRMNETLEAIARAMFKSWFVDFDPVRAKMSGESPESICQRLGLTPDLLALFPDRLMDSELGEIPEGWEVKPLDGIADYLNGLALQKFPPESETEWLPVIKIAQLKKGDAIGADRASFNLKSEYVVNDGDVLFSWSGSLAVDIWCGGRGALNQHLFKVTSANYPKWFYYQWTKHHLENFQAIAAGKAVTMGHIQRKHLTQALCTVPRKPLMEKLDVIMAPLLDKQIEFRKEARTLAIVRDELLPKLLSGELRPGIPEQSLVEAKV